LNLLQDRLLGLAARYGWQVQAWAIFSSHYHLVAVSPQDASTLRRFIGHFHSETARWVNVLDDSPGRRVWFNYWDTHITYQRSYLALRYVHENPVRHGLVPNAKRYRWCSAAWFEASADTAFVKTGVGIQDRSRSGA
jgi:putative transposase